MAAPAEVPQRYALSVLSFWWRSAHAPQIYPAPGRLMPRLNSIGQMRASLRRKTVTPMREKSQRYNLLLRPFPKTGAHRVSRAFCSSWSLAVVVRRYRAILLSSWSSPQSHPLFVFFTPICCYITLKLDLRRSYSALIPTSPLVRSSPHSGPPSMDVPSVPSIVHPSLPRSLPLYSNALYL